VRQRPAFATRAPFNEYRNFSPTEVGSLSDPDWRVPGSPMEDRDGDYPRS